MVLTETLLPVVLPLPPLTSPKPLIVSPSIYSFKKSPPPISILTSPYGYPATCVAGWPSIPTKIPIPPIKLSTLVFPRALLYPLSSLIFS